MHRAQGDLNIAGTLRYITTQSVQATGSISIAGTQNSVTDPGEKFCAAYSGTRCVDWDFTPSTTVDDSSTVNFYVNGQPITGGADGSISGYDSGLRCSQGRILYRRFRMQSSATRSR